MQSGETATPVPTPTPSEAATRLADLLAPTPAARIAATLATVGLIALLTVAVYRLGPLLKRRMDTGTAEAAQSAAVTAFGLLGGAVLIVVWRATPSVRRALSVVLPSVDGGVRLLIVFIALGATYTVTRITKQFIRFGEGQGAITTHQREVLHHVVQIAVFIPATLFVLTLYGVPAENLLLSASALGVVLGFAARQTLGAVLAGFVLLFSRPFEVGDWVQIDENEGTVTGISIVNTRLRTFDGEMVMIPNDQVTDSAVTNRSQNDHLRVQVDVGVDYDTDIGRASTVAVEAMSEVDILLDGPPPEVVVERLGDSAVVLDLRFWIDNPTIQRKWTAQNRVIEAVKSAFEREGITIPFPQRVLSGREQAGGLRVAREGPTSDDESTVEPATDGSGAEE